MTLAVIGNQSLAELERMVTARFSQIANNDSATLPITQKLFAGAVDRPVLPLLLKVKTQKPLRQLHLSFPTPGLRPFYRSKPLTLLGDILGDEGSGSLLSALKAQGLAETLSAGVALSYDDGSVFKVSIGLTRDGMVHYQTVVELVYHAIANALKDLQNDGPVLRRRFAELNTIAANAFRFYGPAPEMQSVISASSSLHFYSPESVLFGDYDYSDYDPETIELFLNHLKPQNMLITLAAHEWAPTDSFDKQSPWYNAPYTTEKIAEERADDLLAIIAEPEQRQTQTVVARLSDQIARQIRLPRPNDFIPQQFALFSSPTAADINNKPELIVDQPGLSLWRQVDDTFEVPRADARFALYSPLVNQSARHQVLANLYAKVVNEQLNEFSYPASLAGLDIGFYAHLRGFTLSARGNNDKMLLLLERALQTFNQLTIDQSRFEELREELLRQWRSALQATPYRRLDTYLSTQLIQHHWDYAESIDILRKISFQDLIDFRALLDHHLFAMGLLHGNISPDMEAGITKLLQRQNWCECSQQQAEQFAIYPLVPGTAKKVLALNHNDAAVAWYFQAQDDSVATIAKNALTAFIFNPQFYHALRTEKQLGYIVSFTRYSLHRWPGLMLSVQSPSSSEAAIATAMQQFISDSLLHPIDGADFQKNKSAFMQQLRQEDSSLHSRSERYWRALSLHETGFDWRQQIAFHLENLSYSEWLEFADQILQSSRRSLMISTVGSASVADKEDKK